MNTPYLIQRANFEKNKQGKGIDALLRFDYMGSAEFEFGALPQSLKRVRANKANYTMFQYSLKSKPSCVLTVICEKSEQDQIGEIIEGLAKNKYRLKEYCDLKDWVSPSESSPSRISDFWWDIENDWFIWKQNTEFDLEFKAALFQE